MVAFKIQEPIQAIIITITIIIIIAKQALVEAVVNQKYLQATNSISILIIRLMNLVFLIFLLDS